MKYIFRLCIQIYKLKVLSYIIVFIEAYFESFMLELFSCNVYYIAFNQLLHKSISLLFV